MWVRVPRLPLKRIVCPWCNWQHGWFQPSWSGFKSLGTCLERTIARIMGSSREQEDAGVACRRSGCNSRWVHCINSPVVQRRRHLAYIQETMVRFHPGLLERAQVRQRAERSGLNPDVCRFESCSGYWKDKWLGRQLADHLGLEPWMLWVPTPPEPLAKQFALVEQPGVLACLSRRRSSVQIRSGVLSQHGTVRKPVKRRSSNLRDRLWVRFPPVLLGKHASAGHW